MTPAAGETWRRKSSGQLARITDTDSRYVYTEPISIGRRARVLADAFHPPMGAGRHHRGEQVTEPPCSRCGHPAHTYDVCHAEKRREADWIVLCGCAHNDEETP